MMDEIQRLLIQALAFLELGFDQNHQTDEDRARHADLMWATHEHVQRAWGLYAAHAEPHQISHDTQILVSTWHAQIAIAEAARKEQG